MDLFHFLLVEWRHRRSGGERTGTVVRLAPHSRDRNGFVRSAQPCWGMAPPRAHPGCVDGRAARSRSRRGMPRLGRTLASRILVAVLRHRRHHDADEFGGHRQTTTHEADARAIEQATGIAVTLGPGTVAQAVQDGDPGRVLARLGEQVRAGTSASLHRHHRPRRHPSLPPARVPDRTTHRGTGRSARRPGPRGGGRRAASAGPPTRGRPSSTPRDARSARCRSAS